MTVAYALDETSQNSMSLVYRPDRWKYIVIYTRACGIVMVFGIYQYNQKLIPSVPVMFEEILGSSHLSLSSQSC